jgi:ribosomal protein L16 Arg81 hydroxylase
MSQSIPTLKNEAAPAGRIRFRDLLHPMAPEEFLDRYFDREPLHLPGPANRFSETFSWDRVSALLDMTTIWSASTLKVVLDGKLVHPAEYCSAGQTRDGASIQQPNPAQVQALIRRGATISLNFVETISPEIARIAAALQCWLNGETVCNIYCSWSGHQGFQTHFDFHDVFVLQIDGKKVWNVYEGQFDEAANIDGYRSNSFSDDYILKTRGRVAKEVTMTPGDVLYIPRGRYHDALATSEATLHLTFGVEFLSGCYFVGAIANNLQDDPFFRQVLPRFDQPDAHLAHMQKLADHVHAYMLQPDLAQGIREQQRRRVFAHCFPSYVLPTATPKQIFRVRGLRTRLVRRGPGWRLERPQGAWDLSGDEASLAEWALAQDFFTADEAAAAHGDGASMVKALERLHSIGLIDAI